MKLLLLIVASLYLVYGQTYYQTLVPLPGGLINQNGYTYLRLSTMLELFGKPCPLSTQCTSVTNPNLKTRIETRRIGKFTLTGMKMALDALSRAFDDVAKNDPNLYNAIGSSGMLCCRTIRGTTDKYSNHAWGAAIDLNMQGQLDPRGDAKCQRGLLLLWPYMAKQGFYWAGGYTGASEDSEHFEIADQVMRSWSKGDWGSCTSTSGAAGTCIDSAQCNRQTQSGRCPGPANIQCCYSDAAPPPPPTYKCVTATTLNIRSGACTTFGILATAQNGDPLLVVNGNPVAGYNNNWIQIRRNGITGYVSVSFTQDCTPLGALEFNSTIGDFPDNGTVFNDGDNDFYYDDTLVAVAGSLSVWMFLMAVLLAVTLF